MSFIDEMWGQSRDWVIGHRERDLPRPRVTPGLAAKWLVDEWALQVEVAQSRLRWPASDYRRRLRDELGDAVEMFNQRGWVDDPRSYHRDPPPLEAPEIVRSALEIAGDICIYTNRDIVVLELGAVGGENE